MNRTRVWLGLTAIFCLTISALARTDFAIRAEGIRVDGRLEGAWFAGVPADSFVQREPDRGKLASLPTRVYVCYDEAALYVGFFCYDPAPDSIRGRVQRRDNDIGSDFVDLYLDTFHDRRNCYWFTVTAAGVQTDGTVASEVTPDASWDGLWQSAVGRTDSGWVAEMRIPFTTIRHGGARPDGWGLNFARKIERRQEIAFWQPVDPERAFHVSEMGTLLGLQDIAPAGHIDILPHAVGRWDAPAQMKWASRNDAENLGGLIKLVPSASWTTDLTYQPDFAQVDIDEAVINLSDYPVFLEERRPFFIEMKDLFDTAPIEQFYTRRITDPDYGARITGQHGSLRGSALVAKNRDSNGLQQDVGVGRGLFNVGRTSTLGFTVTSLSQGILQVNTAGADTRLRWGPRNGLTLAGAAVDGSGNRNSQPVEARASLDQEVRWFLATAAFAYRGKDYTINDLGWGDASNVMDQSLTLTKSYYPRASAFQSLTYETQGFRHTLADGTLPAGGGLARLYGTTRNFWSVGAGIEAGTYYRRDYWLPGDVEQRDNFGVFVPEFHPYSSRWAWIYSDPRRAVETQLTVQDGTFREGHRWSVDPIVILKPRPNLDVTGEMSWQQVTGVREYRNYGIEDFRVWQVRLRYSPALAVSLRGTFQWFEGDRALKANLLLAWNWSPGSWFYLVYDEMRRDLPPPSPLDYSAPGDRTLRAKLTWFFTAAQ
jgi:hypothetical protein